MGSKVELLAHTCSNWSVLSAFSSGLNIAEILGSSFIDASELSAFLDDFRRELQNVTVGKILNKKVPRRIPHEDKYKILTVKGFVFHKSAWKKLKSKLKAE